MNLVRRCIKGREQSYVSSHGIMHAAPLMGVHQNGMVITPGQSWSMYQEAALAGGMHPPDAAQALRMPEHHAQDEYENDAQGEYDYTDTFDPWTGGMYLRATTYRTSFFMEGMKWISSQAPYRVMVCTSTADSNLRSRFYMGMPFL